MCCVPRGAAEGRIAFGAGSRVRHHLGRHASAGQKKKSPHLLYWRRWGDAADPDRSVGCSAVRPSPSHLRILRRLCLSTSTRRCVGRLPWSREFARARTGAPLAWAGQPGGTYRVGRSSAWSLGSDTDSCVSCFVGPWKRESRHDGRGRGAHIAWSDGQRRHRDATPRGAQYKIAGGIVKGDVQLHVTAAGDWPEFPPRVWRSSPAARPSVLRRRRSRSPSRGASAAAMRPPVCARPEIDRTR